MELETVALTGKTPLVRKARDLYRSAFPTRERVPWEGLRRAVRDGRCEMDAYLADGAFAGFSATAANAALRELFYFAVVPERRGGGIGGAVLTQMREASGGVPLALDVELPDPGAANGEERQRRIAFYRRYGFQKTGWIIHMMGEDYGILCSDLGKFRPEDYLALLRQVNPHLPGMYLRQDAGGAEDSAKE